MLKEKLRQKMRMFKSFKNIFLKDKLEIIQQRRNQVIKFLDDAISNRLIDDTIMNELGSSFSMLKREGNKIKKFSIKKEGKSKIIDELNWYLICRKNMSDSAYKSFLPEIFDYSINQNNPYYVMKYYPYPSLRTLVFEYRLKKGQILKIVESVIRSLINNMYSIKMAIDTPSDYVEVTHFKKLKERIDSAVKMRPALKNLMEKNTININGKSYLNVKILMDAIFNDKKIMQKLKPPKLWIIHGDVHYSNILCSVITNKNILVDCRGRSPYGTVQCDVAMDIGKLCHEFRSYYSFIERKEYTLFVHETPQKVIVNFNFRNDGVKKIYDDLIGDIEKLLNRYFDVKKFGNWKYRSEFIEGKHFISMLPFHTEDESESIACFIIGIMRLNEWLKKYHPGLYEKLKRKYSI